MEAVVVPAGPGPSLGGQQAGIGVERGPIGLVADGAERLALHQVRVRQQTQGLVAVGGHHDMVERLGPSVGHQLDTARLPADLADRGPQSYPAFGLQRAQDGFDVALRPAGDGAPARLVPQLSSPWRSKKRAKVAAGIRVNVIGSADQIDEPSGTRYQSRNPADQRCGASTSSSVTPSGGGSASSPRASRLNRPMSASIRQNAGRARLRRWANTVESEVPRHSIPVR